MNTTTLFVALQYVFGLAFSVAGMFIFEKNSNLDLLGGILFSFMVAYISMLIGVALIGYFHLRVKHISRSFIRAFALSFLGLLVFLGLYVLIENYFPDQFGFLAWILPLTGAVSGFNYVVTKYSE